MNYILFSPLQKQGKRGLIQKKAIYSQKISNNQSFIRLYSNYSLLEANSSLEASQIMLFKFQNKEDITNIIEFVISNHFNLLNKKYYKRDEKLDENLQQAYEDYREYVFQDKPISHQIFFWDKKIKIENFYLNILIRILYYTNPKYKEEYQERPFIYPGPDLSKLINLEKQGKEIKSEQANIYFIWNLEDIETIKPVKQGETDIIGYSFWGMPTSNIYDESDIADGECTEEEYQEEEERFKKVIKFIEKYQEKGIVLNNLEKKIQLKEIEEYIKYIEENYDKEKYKEYKKNRKKIFLISFVKNNIIYFVMLLLLILESFVYIYTEIFMPLNLLLLIYIILSYIYIQIYNTTLLKEIEFNKKFNYNQQNWKKKIMLKIKIKFLIYINLIVNYKKPEIIKTIFILLSASIVIIMIKKYFLLTLFIPLIPIISNYIITIIKTLYNACNIFKWEWDTILPIYHASGTGSPGPRSINQIAADPRQP